MEKKIDRRITKTKNNIRNAFIDLMATKDLNQITVTELAAQADIDRKTFYLHYDTIVDVNTEIVADISQKLQLLLNEDVSFSFDHFFYGLNQIMEENLKFYQIICKKDSYSFLLTECTNLLKTKLEERFLTEGISLSPELNIKLGYVSSGIIGVYINWLKNNQGITLSDLAKMLSKETSLLLNSESAISSI